MAKRVEFTFRDGKKFGPRGAEADPVMIKETLSSNRLTKYLTIYWSDGTYSCDCPGWCIAKGDAERTCKHIKQERGSDNAGMTTVDVFAARITEPIQRKQIVIAPRTRMVTGISLDDD
jgi:hypothetical protein